MIVKAQKSTLGDPRRPALSFLATGLLAQAWPRVGRVMDRDVMMHDVSDGVEGSDVSDRVEGPGAPGSTATATADPPVDLGALLTVAVQHHQAGDLGRAEQAYRRVLEHEPDQPDALHLLGVVAHQVGQHEVAVTLIDRAIQARPGVADFHAHLGTVLQALGRLGEASEAYEHAILVQPDHLMALNNLGNVLHSLGRDDEAAATYRRALALRDDLADVHLNLSAVLQIQEQLDEALAHADRALALAPTAASAHNNRGVILHALGRFEEAVDSYHRVLALDRDNPGTYVNLGNALYALHRLGEALEALQQAIARRPDDASPYATLGNVLRDLGRLDDAIAACRQGLALDPADVHLHSGLIFALDLTPGAAQAAWEERRRWNERHAAPLTAASRPHTNTPDPERRLRVGYVSADFRRHSAASALLPILEAHDAARVEVTCYSNSTRTDDVTERFRAAAHRWREVTRLSDAELAQQVRADEIDVLVDLSGYSQGHRLLTFARKPAPVQVTAWGYATGTGLDAIDYFFADAISVPAADRRWYREEVVELPCLIAYGPPSAAPDVAPLPALMRGYVTFGSFNRPTKLSDEALRLWARVLRAVPDARLLLKFAGLEAPELRERILGVMGGAGIDPGRIELRGGTPQVEHLAAYGDVDVVLDSLPHSGGITTLEGLWMGVPAVSLLGDTIAGRISGSLLHAVGLAELVATTPDSYVETAARLAADLPRLAELRDGLRDRVAMSPVMSPRQYTAAVEDGYRMMWRRWCAGAHDRH